MCIDKSLKINNLYVIIEAYFQGSLSIYKSVVFKGYSIIKPYIFMEFISIWTYDIEMECVVSFPLFY